MASKDLPVLSPTYVDHVVGTDQNGNEVSLRFWPVSIKTAFKLSMLAKPLAKSLSVLFGDGQDTKKTTRQTTGGNFEQIEDAITPDLAKLRLDRKAEALEVLVEALTNKRNGILICEFLCDSLRDHYPIGTATCQDAEKLLDSLDAPAFMAYLTGFAKAHEKVFAPFLNRVGGNGVQAPALLPRT